MKKEYTVNPEMIETKSTQKNSIEAREQDVERGGMKFRKPDYDYSMKKKLDLPQSVMSFLRENNLRGRWADEDNIARFEDLGYAIVPESSFGEQKVQLRRFVGKNQEGLPKYQILMATPQEIYEERQAHKELQNQMSEKEMADKAKNVGYESGIDMGLQINKKTI